MRKSIVLAGPFLGLLIAPLLSTMTYANGNGSSLTTTPVSTVLRTSPGHTTSTTIGVMNNTLEPYNVSIQLATFKPYGASGKAQIIKPKPNSAYVSWVHFSQTKFIAEPDVWQKVTMTVNPPSTAGLDYYYAVLLKPSPLSNTAKDVGLTGYNAVLVLLDVASPNARAQLSVSSFSANHGLYEYLPATFNITVRNTGNIFLAPQGDIFISRTSNFSHTLDVIPINTAQGNVIPGSARMLSEQWTDGFPVFTPNTIDGQSVLGLDGSPVSHLTWNFTQANRLRFGKYYAKMAFVYNNGTSDIPTQAVISFWVIPWKVLTVMIAIIILFMVGLYVSGRKLANRTVSAVKHKRKDKVT